jgi:hypothetical protein
MLASMCRIMVILDFREPVKMIKVSKNDKGFIRFAAQESGEAETTDAANVMKPLSELNGESSLAL